MVSLISINLSFKVFADGRADGGLGNVVNKMMLTRVKTNSNDSRMTVPNLSYKTALKTAANMAPDDMAKLVFPHSLSIRPVLFSCLR